MVFTSIKKETGSVVEIALTLKKEKQIKGFSKRKKWR